MGWGLVWTICWRRDLGAGLKQVLEKPGGSEKVRCRGRSTGMDPCWRAWGNGCREVGRRSRGDKPDGTRNYYGGGVVGGAFAKIQDLGGACGEVSDGAGETI